MITSIPALLRSAVFGIAALGISTAADAQFRYTFKDTTTPYAPLTGATSLNGSTVWDDDEFTATIPFTWKLDSVITMTTVPVNAGIPGIVDDFANSGSQTGMSPGFADIVDRGTSSSLSPISYLTTGSAPNRIFKLEFKNAGFWDDSNNADSVDFQIWIYETSNIIEYHYGSSRISAGSDYFFTGAGPLAGGFVNADFDNGSAGTIYYINSSKAIDSAGLATIPVSGFPTNGLSAWPASGTVYRFTPKGASCPRPASTFTSTPQSALAVRFTFTAPTSGVDSLVWDFGDGQKQKVTTSLGTAITHTYTTAGRYNATVTAYNRCGGTLATASQVKVAVAEVAGLTNVRLYPTLVDDAFTLEGLGAGAHIAIYSQTGQKVRELTVGGATTRVSLAGLPAGAYAVQMLDNGSRGSARVIKR